MITLFIIMYQTINLQLHCEILTNLELFLAGKTYIFLDLYFTFDKMFRFVLEWLVVYLLKTKSTCFVSIQNAVYILEEFERLIFLMEFPIFESLPMK